MIRVMFVDDEPRVLDGMRRNLRSHRFIWDMHFVDGGPAALAAMAVAPADVIVADFRMPGMDGGQLLRAVRDEWPDTGRLMLSGHTDADDLLKVVSVAHRLLDKPCSRVDLVAAIEQALWLREAFDGEAIRAEISGIDALPWVSGTLARLRNVVDASGSNARDMAAVVESDIGLTIKVLQLANSSLFGVGTKITSVHQALIRLGLRTIRSISLMLELATPVRHGDATSAWLDRVNAHASLSAKIAARLVRSDQATDAFSAALVAECGQLVFAICRPAAFERLLAAPDLHGGAAANLERDEYNVTHAQAGAYLLSLWGIPTTIVEAVATHDLRPCADLSVPMSVPDAVRVSRMIADRHLAEVCPTADPGADGIGLVNEDWFDADLVRADWSLVDVAPRVEP